MAKKLDKEKAFELAKSFRQLSRILGDYRFDHWNELSAAQRGRLEDMEWTLLNYASDFNAQSILLETAALESDLKQLMKTAGAMQKATKKIQDAKHAINIGTKGLAFGGAIATGNLPVILKAGKSLVEEIMA